MISQSDIAARLRLLRYGLIVLVVTTFLVAFLSPWAFLQGLGYVDAQPALTEFLPNALIATVVVAVLAAIIYVVYSNILKRSMGSSS